MVSLDKTILTALRSRKVLFAVILLGLLLLLEILAVLPGVSMPLERLDLAARDWALNLRGPQPVELPLVIVTIDDASLNYVETGWPWPRTYLAEIVDNLNEAGARLVGLDLFLFSSSLDSGGDQSLADALEQAPAAVGLVQVSRSGSAETLSLPVEPLGSILDGMGIAGVLYDDDAVVRSLQAYDTSTFNGKTYFNWAFEVTRFILDVPPPSLDSEGHLWFNGKQVPLGSRGELTINFAGPPGWSGAYYSAYQVALGDYPSEAFRDKIVLIGATSATLQDLYPTPFSITQRMPGVEVVANAIHTLAEGNFLQVAPLWANLLVLGLAGLGAWLAGLNRRPLVALGWMLVGTLFFTGAWYLAFLQAGIFFAFSSPLLMLSLGVILPQVQEVVTQEMEKRRLRSLFGRFVAPEVVDQMVGTRDLGSLNKRADLTILFSDIRGFTSLSEKLPPEAVVTLLNPYLAAMTAVIHRCGGTVDKYEGDAILAFFGEPLPLPDHPLRAVQAACEMRKELVALNHRWQEEGLLSGRFEMGVGICTGEVFVGLIGSQQRINYTVIGDVVNTAARLQDLTKEYNWPILAGGSTAARVKTDFDLDFIEARIVKGRQEPVEVYRVLGPKGRSDQDRVDQLLPGKGAG